MFHRDPMLSVLLVYDYGLSPSDLAGEKILLINGKMIDARIKVHGPPPTELQTQRDWYQDVLRESLKVAAKTVLVLQKETSPSQQDINNSSIASSYARGPNATDFQGTGYDLPLMATSDEITPGFQMTATHESQVSSISSHHTGLALSTSSFLRNDQEQNNLMTALSRNLAGEASAPSSMMSGEMTDLDAWQINFQQDMAEDATGQLFGPQGSFGFTEDYDVAFQPPGPAMLGNSQDQSFWPRQQGKR
jgi:hypothetical protein